MKQPLFVKNRFGEKLEVLLRTPEVTGKFPGILFVSGFGMDLHEYKNSFDEISEYLVREGYVTLQFSFAGRGNSAGDYREMTLERQGMQVEDMTAWFANHGLVNRDRLGLFAQSFGAPSSLYADLGIFKTICLNGGAYYPGRSLRQVFIQERDVKVEADQDVKLPRSDGTFTVVGKQFFPNIDQFRPEVFISSLTQPMFLLHGSQDTKVKTAEVKSIYEMIRSTNKKLKIFEGGGHCINDAPPKMRAEFLETVVEWFKETL